MTESIIIDSRRELSSNSATGPEDGILPSSNYRPISLTSVIIKVLERIIHKKIFAFLISKGYLTPTRFEDAHAYRPS